MCNLCSVVTAQVQCAPDGGLALFPNLLSACSVPTLLLPVRPFAAIFRPVPRTAACCASTPRSGSGSAAKLARLQKILMQVGACAEYVTFGQAEGGLNDVQQLDGMLRALQVPCSASRCGWVDTQSWDTQSCALCLRARRSSASSNSLPCMMV